ncbi:hypothetical protein E8E12_003148 [Didymella heteroderae]|uniref:F-box domain-containing protein n=1 Tax=Didymella heteroderae TaxID=1769908 RepID=A0A9P4WHX8_9PLEO|nr:hypothetical protein E8E12_003148 [Didymella heteroderae]
MSPRYAGLTYPKLRINDHTLDDQLALLPFGPKYNCACSRASSSLGALDNLPIELLTEVLLQLDLRTLADFRYVNHRARQLVDSIPQYKAIAAHAPNVIRGVLSIGTGRWTTVDTLHGHGKLSYDAKTTTYTLFLRSHTYNPRT